MIIQASWLTSHLVVDDTFRLMTELISGRRSTSLISIGFDFVKSLTAMRTFSEAEHNSAREKDNSVLSVSGAVQFV